MTIPPDFFREYSRHAALRWLGGKSDAGAWVNTRDGWVCFADIVSASGSWKLRDSDRLWTTEAWPSEVDPELFFPYVFVERERGLYIYAGTGRPVRYGVRDGRFDAEIQLDPGLALSVARSLRAAVSSPTVGPPEWLADVARDPRTAIARFAAWWYGDVLGPLPEAPPAAGVPFVLRWLHGSGLARSHQNRFVPLPELATEDGKMTFYMENQGVCLWACDSRAKEGAVWIRSSDEPDWRMEAERLTPFLLQACVYEALVSAPERAGASWLAPEQAARLTTRLSEITAPPWSWPAHPHRFFAGSDLLASVCPNEDGVTVSIGSHSAGVLDTIRDGIEASWD